MLRRSIKGPRKHHTIYSLSIPSHTLQLPPRTRPVPSQPHVNTNKTIPRYTTNQHPPPHTHTLQLPRGPVVRRVGRGLVVEEAGELLVLLLEREKWVDGYMYVYTPPSNSSKHTHPTYIHIYTDT